jgi:hypothetical protein
MTLDIHDVRPSGEPDIVIDGVAYRHIKDRLMRGKVYGRRDGGAYLRTASPMEIAEEVSLTSELHRRGFPVPHVLGHGECADGTAYYIENSIGDRVFGSIFMDETKDTGSVSDTSFDAFVASVRRYAEAQFEATNLLPGQPLSLDGLVGLENVMRNNPPVRRTRFEEAYGRAVVRVCELPWGFLQADLNAFNVLAGGVIDFELATVGPVGYDSFTCVYFGRMWPRERIAYVFSESQIERYLAMLDETARKKGIPPPRNYANDFLVLKAIWATGKDPDSEKDPTHMADFWRWRVAARDWCIEEYLAGRSIDTRVLDAASNPSAHAVQ